MYYNVKICRSDKMELDNLLDRYIKNIGGEMSGSAFTTCGELESIKNDLDLIIRIRTALESAEEIPIGEE